MQNESMVSTIRSDNGIAAYSYTKKQSGSKALDAMGDLRSPMIHPIPRAPSRQTLLLDVAYIQFRPLRPEKWHRKVLSIEATPETDLQSGIRFDKFHTEAMPLTQLQVLSTVQSP
jgi:hypothetical protein